MPSTYQSGSRGRETFPKLRRQIGEDPARYLDHAWPYPTGVARIRGIDRIPVARAFQAVERALERGGTEKNPAPREVVLDLIEDRISYLEANGEREEHFEELHDRDRPPAECYIVRADGSREPYAEARDGTATSKIAEKRATSGSEEADA